MRLALQLAWRFRSSKRQNGFISFISASSTIGIALGCCVLILLLSVMNGFERELKTRLLSVLPHGEIWSVDTMGIDQWQSAVKRLAEEPRVLTAQPFTKATGMLQKGREMKAVEILGLQPDFVASSSMVNNTPDTALSDFAHSKDSVLLGEGVLQALGVSKGDKVQLLLPQLSNDLALKPPKTIWLTVAGSLSMGGEMDSHIGIMHLGTVSEALGIQSGAKGIRFQFTDPFEAPNAMRKIGFDFPQHVFLSDWTRTQGHLYQDIQLVRTVVYLVLTLVIAVACFNIVSTLVMAVNEKQAEIAMLKTMGARDKMIVQVFVFQGIINGLVGTVFGVGAGVLLARHLTEVASFFESLLGVKFLSGDVYFVDFLPSQLVWHEVYLTAAIALALSFVATLYPAKKAAAIHPAEALGK